MIVNIINTIASYGYIPISCVWNLDEVGDVEGDPEDKGGQSSQSIRILRYTYVPHPKIDTTHLLYVHVHYSVFAYVISWSWCGGHSHRAEPVTMEQIFLLGRIRRSLSCIPLCMHDPTIVRNNM